MGPDRPTEGVVEVNTEEVYQARLAARQRPRTIEARLTSIEFRIRKHHWVKGKEGKKLYVLPGVTGDQVTDDWSDDCAFWNRHRGEG